MPVSTENGPTIHRLPNERRKYPRLQARGAGALHPGDDDHATDAMAIELHDVSRGRVSFSAVRQFAMSDGIAVPMRPVDASAEPIRMAASIRWVGVNLLTGMSRVGCAFERELSPEELASLTCGLLGDIS